MIRALPTLLLPLLAAPGGHQEARPEVELSLVSDAAAIEPGATFEVAALFEIEEGWHIYWKNPGDSGAPTHAELLAPEGFAVAGPFFPAPERFDLPADMQSFGYHGPAVLFFRVTVPEDASAGADVPLSLRAEWLVCKEVCFLGKGEDRLRLAVGGRGGARERVSHALQRARARLPRPFEGPWSWDGDFQAEESGKRVRTLALTTPSPVTEFFPDPSGGLRLRSKTISGDPGGGSVVKLVLETRGETADKWARGVLKVPAAEGDRYYEFNVSTDKESNR